MAGHTFRPTGNNPRPRPTTQVRKKPAPSASSAREPEPITVKFDVLLQFTITLAAMLTTEIPIVRAIRALSQELTDPKFKEILEKLVANIESGSSFSEALASYPGVFSKTYIATVKAGESSGTTGESLKRLGSMMDKDRKIRGKVKSAMTYPLVVLCLAFCILMFLMISIVPKFKDIFDDILDGKPLPLITRVVMAMSNGLVDNLMLVAITIIALIVGLRFAVRTEKGRRRVDWLKLNAPLFGVLYRKVAIARFSRTFGGLMASGVQVLDALNIARDTAGNFFIERAIQIIHDAVQEGENINVPMSATGIFPPTMVIMVAIGEETSQLPELLEAVAVRYEEEVDNTVTALTSIIEPIMIVLLALIVGTIVLAIFLPMVELLKGFS